MVRVYAGAGNVLVLDPELRTVVSGDLTPAELDLAVAASPWMARSWTLHEGALAIDLHFKFADTILAFAVVSGASGTSSLLSQSGVQKLWSGEIISKDHPERREFLSRYASRVLNNLMFNEQVQPFVKSSSEDYESERFLTTWNDLAGRSTTQPGDIAAIFASLLHASAGEVLGLPEDMRMKALSKTQPRVPVSLLFVPSSSSSVDWTPDFPECNRTIHKLARADNWMHLTDSGFALDSASPILICQSDVPTTGKFLIQDIRRKQTLFIAFDAGSTHQADALGGANIFFFSDVEDSLCDSFKGLCLIPIRNDHLGLYVRFHKTFSWRYCLLALL